MQGEGGGADVDVGEFGHPQRAEPICDDVQDFRFVPPVWPPRRHGGPVLGDVLGMPRRKGCRSVLETNGFKRVVLSRS